MIVTGCDTGTKRATVENQCGETLMIAVVEAPVPNAHGYAGAGAEAYGESVAPGSSNEYALMASAGGFVIEAEASDGSVYRSWHGFDDPERSFTLSPATGTCAQPTAGEMQN